VRVISANITTNAYVAMTVWRFVERAKSSYVSCSGCIVGMGRDKIRRLLRSLYALRGTDVDSIPVNFFNVISVEHPFENNKEPQPAQNA